MLTCYALFRVIHKERAVFIVSIGNPTHPNRENYITMTSKPELTVGKQYYGYLAFTNNKHIVHLDEAYETDNKQTNMSYVYAYGIYDSGFLLANDLRIPAVVENDVNQGNAAGYFGYLNCTIQQPKIRYQPNITIVATNTERMKL